MKTLISLIASFFIFCTLLSNTAFAQNEKKPDSLNNKDHLVTTVGMIDPNETKSGYRINDYYVELSRTQVDTLIGKKISVTGKLIVIRGMENAFTMEQGSYTDRRIISRPKIVYVTEEKKN